MDVYNQSLRLTYEIDNTNYWVNGVPVERQVQQETPPIIRNGRTFILLRYLTKHLPWIEDISFEKNDQLYPKGRVEIVYGNTDKRLYLYVDNPTAEITEDGVTRSIRIDPDNNDVVPFIVSGRLHLPLRFLGQQTEAIKILWDEDEKKAELWYLGPYAIPSSNRPPKGKYSVSQTYFDSVEHCTEQLSDYSSKEYCLEDYWKVTTAHKGYDEVGDDIKYLGEIKEEYICISEELKNKIDRIMQEDTYVMYKYLYIYPHKFIVDVESENIKKDDCCDYDLEIEYEKRDDVDNMGFIYIDADINCDKQIILYAECTNNILDLGANDLFITALTPAFGNQVSLGKNNSIMPEYNPIAHREYAPDHRYNIIYYRDAVDTETSEDGRIHIAWVERRYRYNQETEEMYDVSLLNYAFYDEDGWKVVGGDPYPESNPCIAEEELIYAVDLAIDTDGNPHLSWIHRDVYQISRYNKDEYDVISYARWNGTKWIDIAGKDIDESKSVFDPKWSWHTISSSLKLMLNKDNEPYLVWVHKDGHNTPVCFAMAKDGQWVNWEGITTQTDFRVPSFENVIRGLPITSTNISLRPISVVMDSQGNIHCAYQSGVDGESYIYYRKWDGDSWSEVGDPIYYLQGINPYITLDREDNPVIVWEDAFITNTEAKAAMSRIFFIRQTDDGWVNIEGNSIEDDSACVIYQSTCSDLKPEVFVMGEAKYYFTYETKSNNYPDKIVQRYWDDGWYHSGNYYSNHSNTFPITRNTSYTCEFKPYATCIDANSNDMITCDIPCQGIQIDRIMLDEKKFQSLSGELVEFDFTGSRINTNHELVEARCRFTFEYCSETYEPIDPDLFPIVVEFKVISDCGVEKELSVEIESLN